MNLTLYAVTAFIILDTDGNRVLSKYYRQESNPSSSKGLANTKEQRAFEKGLWQKTKKSGGSPIALSLPLPRYVRSLSLTYELCVCALSKISSFPLLSALGGSIFLDHTYTRNRRYHPL